MLALIGLGLLVVAIVLLQASRPKAGKQVSRAEWVDITLAIAITAGFAGGAMLLIMGTASYLPAYI